MVPTKWRIFPVISYTNYRRLYGKSTGAFRSWFSVHRRWGGRLIYVSVRHWSVCFDFRKNWLLDLVGDERREKTGSIK